MPESAAPRRSCSKQTCNREAVCTLTYVYSDSTAVIGALSARREPHAYDLCAVHADTLTAPRGWRVVRLEAPGGWDRDDLDDVAQAVRRDDPPQTRRVPGRRPSLGAAQPGAPRTSGVRVLRDVSYRGGDEDPGTSGEDSSAASRPTPGGASEPPVDEYPGTARSVAKAHHPLEPSSRSVPLPESLRIPHWRRP